MDVSSLINTERKRLNYIGIPYIHIHVIEGIPIAILSSEEFSKIVERRNNGDQLPGHFITQSDKGWSASYIDKEGRHHSHDKLTECRAYRWILGYPIGHAKKKSRYKGGPTCKPRKKTL